LGYFGGANILMEYVFSNAAVARSFTEYLSFAFGENNPNVWRVEVHGLPKDYNMLDFPAVALILLLTLCLCHRFVSFIASVFHVSRFKSCLLRWKLFYIDAKCKKMCLTQLNCCSDTVAETSKSFILRLQNTI